MKLKKQTLSTIIIIVSLSTVIGLSGLNFLFSPQLNNSANQNNATSDSSQAPVPQSMEKITIKTSDNVNVAANFYPVKNQAGWIVFVHMLPETKESWDGLAKAFQAVGYEGLAIDLRGHGESDGGPNSYASSTFDHTKSINDLMAAAQYLLGGRGATPDKISFVGASIGANLSLQFVADNSDFKTAVLLSAGLNYHGVDAKPYAAKLQAGQRVYFVTSKDDNGDTKETQTLYDAVPQGVTKDIKIYDTAGHGTAMLQKEQDLANLIANFIASK